METMFASAAIALGTIATVFALLLTVAVRLCELYTEEHEDDEDSSGHPDREALIHELAPATIQR